jgi:hypothetical protein
MGILPGVKRPGRSADHPPLSKAEVKERVDLYIYSPSGFWWPVPGRTFTFTFTITFTFTFLMISLAAKISVTYPGVNLCRASRSHVYYSILTSWNSRSLELQEDKSVCAYKTNCQSNINKQNPHRLLSNMLTYSQAYRH